MKLEEMKPHEIDEMLKKTPVVYIPWGSLEWHGVHNPIGLDAIKAYHLCLCASEKTGGAVLPPVYAGCQTMKPYMGYKKTIEISKEIIKKLAMEYLEQLNEEGFRVFFILMGHYSSMHVDALREVAEEFSKNHSCAKCVCVPDHELATDLGVQGDHAGIYETSLLMHFRPELVDLKLLPKNREINFKDDGITGNENVMKSTPENGERIANFIVEKMVTKVQELLKQA